MKKPFLFHVKHSLLLAIMFPLFSWAQHFSTSTIQLKPMPDLPAKNNSIEQYLQSFPAYNTMSAEAKEWFYWTNYSRKNPRAFYDSIVVPVLKTFPNLQSSYVNSLRRDLYAASPLGFVRPSPLLGRVAQTHADELRSRKSSPSHTSPSGVTFQSRMMNANVKNCAGENISYGPLNTVLALVFLYIDENIPDVGHRKTLMSPVYTEMGVGVSAYPDGSYMVVQDFSCDQ
jgi:uncharacterized protein YkwD